MTGANTFMNTLGVEVRPHGDPILVGLTTPVKPKVSELVWTPQHGK